MGKRRVRCLSFFLFGILFLYLFRRPVRHGDTSLNTKPRTRRRRRHRFKNEMLYTLKGQTDTRVY